MITKTDLLNRVQLDAQRRVDCFNGIDRHFDSVIAPTQEVLSCHTWADAYEVNFGVTGDANDLATFFRIMRTHKFEPDSRPKVGDTTFSTRFRHHDGTVFYLSFTSTVCRRVQVGTRTVEEPVYEIQCGDDPVPVDMAEAAPPSPEESLS
jgi:hypothetical protein